MKNNPFHMAEFEEILVEKFGERANGLDDIPEIWRRFPLSWLCYGEREVCIRETSPMWNDNDTMSDIIDLFDTYYGVIVDKINRTVGIDVLDNKRSIGIYIQPDYSDTSKILIIQRNLNNLAYIKETKAWHMSFETPEEMEIELQNEFESILENIK